jgi:hypothetical protein
MRARVLEPHEWHRLSETDLDPHGWPSLDPSTVHFVVVEDAAGAIVACWGAMSVRMVEGFWVRPDHQKKGGTLRRLFVGMRTLLHSLGTTAVVTQAETPEIAALLTAAGAQARPGTSFVLPVDFGPWQRAAKD